MSNITRKQFDILDVLASETGALTQRQLEEKTGYSLGTINRTVKELSEAGFVFEGTITPAGLTALEPYRVKRAVFIAAGFGSRLVPVTLNTPKPLVRVNGQRLIDGLIDAVLAAGIDEIYIVRGYLAEQFDQLFVLYEVETTIYDKEGTIISVGLGSCNSKERKYQRSDFAGNLNTILKMAKKRSYVDAILTACHGSGVFTQDIEDIASNVQSLSEAKEA